MFKTFLSIVFLITAITIFFVWTKPFYVEVNTLNDEQKVLNNLLDSSKEIKQIRDDLNDDYKSISSDNVNRLSKLLPKQPDSIRFILEMEKVIKTNGMVLKDINIEGSEKDKGKESGEKDSSLGKKVGFGGKKTQEPVGQLKSFEEIPLGLRVAGSYKSFYSFLEAAEKNLRLMDIKGLRFSSDKADFYEFAIDAVIYSKK